MLKAVKINLAAKPCDLDNFLFSIFSPNDKSELFKVVRPFSKFCTIFITLADITFFAQSLQIAYIISTAL